MCALYNLDLTIYGDFRRRSIHSSWVHDLKADFDDPKSATLGTELVTTSISADFPAQFIAPVTAALADNPHARYFNGSDRGYVRCELTPQT